jgi:zinc transport system substrate-binding protein
MPLKKSIHRGLKRFYFCFLSALIVIFSLCFVYTVGIEAGGDQNGRLTIYVVNYPLKYFAERIAGEHANVVLPIPADEDPAFWMPNRKTISDYQRADLILLNGADYAKWVNKVTLPQFRVVDTSAESKEQFISVEGTVTHTHGPTGEHAHKGVAFTTWIDFELATEQAKAITKALSRKRPAFKDTFQSNFKELEKDLITIDRDIMAIVANKPEQQFVASHPVYEHFAKRYGLDIISVHWEPEQVTSEKQWVELQNILKGHPAKWMIWEGEPDPVSVARLESMGVNSFVFDPCGNAPGQNDFLSVMLKNVENLKLAF